MGKKGGLSTPSRGTPGTQVWDSRLPETSMLLSLTRSAPSPATARSWPHLDRNHHQDEDGQDRHHPKGLPPLHQEVQQVREEAQEHGCPPLALLQGREGR